MVQLLDMKNYTTHPFTQSERKQKNVGLWEYFYGVFNVTMKTGGFTGCYSNNETKFRLFLQSLYFVQVQFGLEGIFYLCIIFAASKIG